jgi:hypothetical protein
MWQSRRHSTEGHACGNGEAGENPHREAVSVLSESAVSEFVGDVASDPRERAPVVPSSRESLAGVRGG